MAGRQLGGLAFNIGDTSRTDGPVEPPIRIGETTQVSLMKLVLAGGQNVNRNARIRDRALPVDAVNGS